MDVFDLRNDFLTPLLLKTTGSRCRHDLFFITFLPCGGLMVISLFKPNQFRQRVIQSSCLNGISMSNNIRPSPLGLTFHLKMKSEKIIKDAGSNVDHLALANLKNQLLLPKEDLLENNQVKILFFNIEDYRLQNATLLPGLQTKLSVHKIALQETHTTD